MANWEIEAHIDKTETDRRLNQIIDKMNELRMGSRDEATDSLNHGMCKVAERYNELRSGVFEEGYFAVTNDEKTLVCYSSDPNILGNVSMTSLNRMSFTTPEGMSKPVTIVKDNTAYDVTIYAEGNVYQNDGFESDVELEKEAERISLCDAVREIDVPKAKPEPPRPSRRDIWLRLQPNEPEPDEPTKGDPGFEFDI